MARYIDEAKFRAFLEREASNEEGLVSIYLDKTKYLSDRRINDIKAVNAEQRMIVWRQVIDTLSEFYVDVDGGTVRGPRAGDIAVRPAPPRRPLFQEVPDEMELDGDDGPVKVVVMGRTMRDPPDAALAIPPRRSWWMGFWTRLLWWRATR